MGLNNEVNPGRVVGLLISKIEQTSSSWIRILFLKGGNVDAEYILLMKNINSVYLPHISTMCLKHYKNYFSKNKKLSAVSS